MVLSSAWSPRSFRAARRPPFSNCSVTPPPLALKKTGLSLLLNLQNECRRSCKSKKTGRPGFSAEFQICCGTLAPALDCQVFQFAAPDGCLPLLGRPPGLCRNPRAERVGELR